MKSGRKRQIPYDLTYMWNLKNKTHRKRFRFIVNIIRFIDRVCEMGKLDEGGKSYKLPIRR